MIRVKRREMISIYDEDYTNRPEEMIRDMAMELLEISDDILRWREENLVPLDRIDDALRMCDYIERTMLPLQHSETFGKTVGLILENIRCIRENITQMANFPLVSV